LATPSGIPAAAVAGGAYFAAVFAAGFALGTVRVLAVEPALGETGAVAVELPVMLAASWLACGWSLARFDVPRRLQARAVMGGLAFALLMLAELGMSMLGFGRTLTEHLTRYRDLPAALGLAGQLVFASFPMLRLR
jgi:hypothetical protein